MMRSRLAIALGGIFAGLVTMPADSFVAPPPMVRRTVPGAGFDGDQLMMVNLPDVRAVGRILVPPIPKQEAPINRLSDQFRPRFVAKEFLIGVRYMMRMFPLLIASSIVCHIIRASLNLPEGMVEFGRSSYGILHQLEQGAKLIAANILKFSLSEMPGWFEVSLVPLFEEMSYRGFGHMLGRFGAVLSLLPFAWLCRWGPGPAAAWCGFHAVTVIAGSVGGKTIASVCNMLGEISEFALVLPAQVLIINMLRKQKEKVPKVEDASNVTNVTSEQKKNAVNIITSLALGKETKAPVELERKLEQSFSRSARFFGAKEFGASHAVVGGGLPIEAALMHLQKGFGTFASSLLVESRLVVNRRNLWGAVGAHTAFNALSSKRVLPLLLRFVFGTDMPLYLRFFRLSVSLMILHKGLEFLCSILQNVNDIYLS